jgi:hypothetical protein
MLGTAFGHTEQTLIRHVAATLEKLGLHFGDIVSPEEAPSRVKFNPPLLRLTTLDIAMDTPEDALTILDTLAESPVTSLSLNIQYIDYIEPSPPLFPPLENRRPPLQHLDTSQFHPQFDPTVTETIVAPFRKLGLDCATFTPPSSPAGKKTSVRKSSGW